MPVTLAREAERRLKKAFVAFGRAGMEAHFRALTDKPYVMDKSRGRGVHFDLLNLVDVAVSGREAVRGVEKNDAWYFSPRL